MKFKEFLTERSVNENKFYHISSKKYKIGQKIYSEEGYLYAGGNEDREYAIDELRPDDKPGRGEVIYSTLVPESRFLSKQGTIYEVNPLGDYFITDSSLIDKMADTFVENEERFEKLVKQYWEGIPENKARKSANIRNLEVLSEGIEIIKNLGTPKVSGKSLEEGELLILSENLKVPIQLVMKKVNGKKVNISFDSYKTKAKEQEDLFGKENIITKTGSLSYVLLRKGTKVKLRDLILSNNYKLKEGGNPYSQILLEVNIKGVIYLFNAFEYLESDKKILNNVYTILLNSKGMKDEI